MAGFWFGIFNDQGRAVDELSESVEVRQCFRHTTGYVSMEEISGRNTISCKTGILQLRHVASQTRIGSCCVPILNTFD